MEDRPKGALFGLVLLLPAVCGCVTSFAIPTVATFTTSLTDARALRQQSEVIGLENYTQIIEGEAFSQALLFTGMGMAMRLMIVIVLAILIGLGISGLPRTGRMVARLASVIPLGLFAPVAVVITWLLVVLGPLREAISIFQAPRLLILGVDALLTVLLGAGVAAVIMPVASRRARPHNASPTTAAALVILGLAVVALSLQTYATPFLITGGAQETATLGVQIYRIGTQVGALGQASAWSMAMIVPLLALGLLAGLILVVGNLSLDVMPRDSADPEASPGLPILLLIVGALIVIPAVLAVFGIVAAALLTDAPGTSFGLEAAEIATGVLNTYLPPLLMLVLVQLPVSVLGALGIGALRPLGKRSELLLIPFVPWLFFTTLPLGLFNFQRYVDLDLLGTFFGTLRPMLISIPMLVVLTLFYKGRYTHWRADGGDFGALIREVLLPSLPLILLMVLAGFVIGINDLFWPGLTAFAPETRTLAIIAQQVIAVSGAAAGSGPVFVVVVAALMLVPALLIVVIMALLHVITLDWLVLFRGQPALSRDEIALALEAANEEEGTMLETESGADAADDETGR